MPSKSIDAAAVCSLYDSRFGWMGEPHRILTARVVPGRIIGAPSTPALRVVAVEGAVNDWAAYAGPVEWDERRVADEGNKLYHAHACEVFQLLKPGRYRL